tara:strand:- start:312 stop:473 length:162 start_codon:yes stop_codon:yes gene_type:complete
MKDLNSKELKTISGGESFAYRIGQLVAIGIDIASEAGTPGYSAPYIPGRKIWY